MKIPISQKKKHLDISGTSPACTAAVVQVAPVM